MDKDIRFPDKKVDDGWKESVNRDGVSKDKTPPRNPQSTPTPTPTPVPAPEPSHKNTASSKTFLNLITSLGYQAMMHLGEIPYPESNMRETNLDAAREMIDLLATLKQKTEGNLSAEEEGLLQNLIAELQLKYTAHV